MDSIIPIIIIFFIFIQIFIIRKVLRINDLINNQIHSVRLLMGIAEKMNVDQFYFPPKQTHEDEIQNHWPWKGPLNI